jgi:hypothetical protein
MSYNIDLYFAINEVIQTANIENILKLDKITYIKDKIDYIKNLSSRYELEIYFEDYDIILEQDKYVAKYKNIGISIKNNVINFIKEIKENYSISLITNDNTNKVIYKYNRYKNINNSDKNNIKNVLDEEIYNLVNIN